MWEQLDLFDQQLGVAEQKTIYFARPLTVTGLSSVGQFVSAVNESEILNGQIVTTIDKQLFAIEKPVASTQVIPEKDIIQVTKTQQNLEQFLSDKLQASYPIIRILFDE
ncbi:hypothetical protein PWO95_05305 [Weissella paramesenteroides]|uniref:hypothetical protein n=1 Tax=Weissella paramesenteroides TaxID=1249 RepID=UPI0023AA126B|nr:hypothetical protein [Weissella paramesenteroides]WEA52077.1 hypothetical protein PWO95_05305 [Weissella paramesenteroides]